MNSEYEQEQQIQEIYEDDLADFQDQQGDRICNQIMNFKKLIEDDAQQLQKNNQQTILIKKQLSKVQKDAKQLKLKNARKYFQIVKLTYLKQIISSLKQAKNIRDQSASILMRFFSLLNKELLEQYQKLIKIQTISINPQDVLVFLRKAYKFIGSNKLEIFSPWCIFWSVCQSLKLAVRKVYFFDLQQLVQETVYKLNYHNLEKALKKQKKRAKQHQKMKIQIDLKRQQQEKQENKDYLHFQDFQFDVNTFQSSRSDRQSQSRLNTSSQQSIFDGMKSRRQNNFLRKRNYKWAYFQIYSILQNKWKLINSQLLQYQQQQQIRNYLLSSKPIIGFYSFRIIHFKQNYNKLKQLRLFQDIILQDLTMYFYDNIKNLSIRRKRVGIKNIMRLLFQKGNYNRYYWLLNYYDQYIMKKCDQISLEFHLQYFPNNQRQMFNSDYFITPSQLPQYCILDHRAKPIDKQFFQEKVYLKKDMIPVTSRMVWIDRGRKVKPNQIPVKKTENKSKNLSQLFLYQQTEPFELNIDKQTGNFIFDDQYNSIYVPPRYQFQNCFSLISKSIHGICNRYGFKHAQIVQGFSLTAGRILPNIIGYLIYKQDESRIIQLWQQKQKQLIQNKQKNRQKYLYGLWNKLFTKIQLSQWSQSFSKN